MKNCSTRLETVTDGWKQMKAAPYKQRTLHPSEVVVATGQNLDRNHSCRALHYLVGDGVLQSGNLKRAKGEYHGQNSVSPQPPPSSPNCTCRPQQPPSGPNFNRKKPPLPPSPRQTPLGVRSAHPHLPPNETGLVRCAKVMCT